MLLIIQKHTFFIKVSFFLRPGVLVAGLVLNYAHFLGFVTRACKDKIDSNKIIEYYDLLDWLYVYQKNSYLHIPSTVEIHLFKLEKEA